jgi:LPPG:FO 2-phospho-L-lactate transferase
VNVAVLSGGVGGARFLRGLVGVVDPGNVSIVGNIADDVEVLGLHVSPDLDSILYTLTGRSDEERGWGRADESWRALETVAELGGESWFRLGDRDLGLHLMRTQLLHEGATLSEATEQIAHALGLVPALLPATDDPVRTFLETPAGTFPFQTWFVARGHRDEVDAVHYAGSPTAVAAPGVLDALRGADLLVIAPSNPYVSIGPILAVAEIREALVSRVVPCVAVSPLVGGRAVKGPADRMLKRLAGGTEPAHVASCYEGLIDVLVVDERDAPDGPVRGVERTVVTQTLMTDLSAARRLAAATVHASGALARRSRCWAAPARSGRLSRGAWRRRERP